MWKTIKKYHLGWSFNDHSGFVYLFDDKQGSPCGIISIDTWQEFSAIGDFLRNEKPLYYNTASKILTTTMEPVGEEESA